MLILVGYIVEFIIALGWYKLIVVKELKCKNIVRRSIQIFFAQRRNLMISFWGWGKISEEQEKAVCSIRNYMTELFMEIYMFIVYVILGPVLLKYIINCKNRDIIETC